jgi:ABC-type transport system involved in multi-copper enzyme maturation permease subunit
LRGVVVLNPQPVSRNQIIFTKVLHFFFAIA